MSAIQITVFTGFLGAGKTSIILSLLPKLPKDYKLIHNPVDSQLARQSSLAAVSEITNGCMCCVLIGRMKHALQEIRDKYAPDRIIIETSGSAFPAPLVLQIRELARETDNAFSLDCVATVVDCENFRGYEDVSPTAQMQAQFSDVILLVPEHVLDRVLDEVHTLNDLTPKIRTNGRLGVDPELIFNLDSKLASGTLSDSELAGDGAHNDEIGVVTISKAKALSTTEAAAASSAQDITREQLDQALSMLPKESVYRVKGFMRLGYADGSAEIILNWAFGRFDLTPLAQSGASRLLEDSNVLLTVMGHPGEVRRYASRLATALGAKVI
ncbi:cobW-domain-containing protein [Auriculariales sp. MPI-PUGE-AT-0066]|nr:cobW-domain-containing protein [Auriculariales sp. MPI-PUGE-AT-0066]